MTTTTTKEQKQLIDPEKNNQKLPNVNKSDLIAPDGGWGWIIVIAYAMANVSLFRFWIELKIKKVIDVKISKKK